MLSKIETKIVSPWVHSYETKKGIRWRICVPDGRGNQKREQGLLTKEAALEKANQLLKYKLSNQGIIGSNERILFSEYAQIWFQQKQLKDVLRNQTKQRYAHELKRLVSYFGDLKLGDIRKQHLRDFILHLRGNDESEYCVRYSVALFKQLIRVAEEDDLIPPTGIYNIRIKKPKKKEPKFLGAAQVERAVREFKGKPEAKLFAFAILTGMRAGEIAGLKGDSVLRNSFNEDVRGVIWVRRSLEQKTGLLVETTKNGDNRRIPITPEIDELIPKNLSPEEFVFGGKEPIETTHLARRTRKMLKLLDLPQMTFHELRHSACSYWEAMGIPRRCVQAMMGHRDGKTTERYSHMDQETINQEMVSALLRRKQNSNNVLSVDFANAR